MRKPKWAVLVIVGVAAAAGIWLLGSAAVAQVYPPADQEYPVAYFMPSNAPSQGFVEPLPTTEAARTFVLVDGKHAITDTLVSDSPLIDAFKRDASATTGYASADVFFSAEGEGDWELGAIVEMSADRVHWAQNAYEYYNSYVVDAMPVGRTLTPEMPNEYQQVQLAGAYMRVRLQPTGVVTPTVSVTYRRASNASE